MKWFIDLVNTVRPHLPKTHQEWELFILRFTFIMWVVMQSVHTLMATYATLFRGII